MPERSQSRVPFYEGDVGAFYSSEVWPPFLVEQVLSLQSKSPPCRASLLLAAQILSLQSKSLRIWNVVSKSGPSLCQGPYTKNGLDLLWAHGHGPIGLAKPYLIFYPLQIRIVKIINNWMSTLLIWFCCPKSLLLILFSWLHQTRKSSPLFLLLFLCFCFLLSLLSHCSLLSLTKTKYPSLKKKLKG